MSPTRRPAGRAAQRQSWHELLFLHWSVPVEALRPLVPSRLEIDTYEGRAYVGLVPFTMTGVRPVWAPAVPGLSSFHEVNVRTYVHLGGREPGVWFLSLDASSLLAVLIARATYHLPYRFARMSLTRGPQGEVRYSSERRWPGPTPAACAMRYWPVGSGGSRGPGLARALPGRALRALCRAPRASAAGPRPPPAVPAASGRVRGPRRVASWPRPACTTGPSAPLAHYAKGVSVELFALADC